MKNLLLFVLLGLAVCSMPANAGSISNEDLEGYYGDLFTADVKENGDEKYIVLKVINPPENHPLAELVCNHRLFLNYLLQNGSDADRERLTELKQDVEALKKEFQRQLKGDEKFGQVVLPLFSRVLNMKGIDVDGLDLPPRSEISIDDCPRVAVRFFYPNRVVEEGISANICVGKHGLADFEGERNLILEALAFAAIVRDMQSEEKALYQEFYSVLEDIVELGLSSDDETKLKRAQGAVWFTMLKSEQLIKCLRQEYNSMRDLLPFEILIPGASTEEHFQSPNHSAD